MDFLCLCLTTQESETETDEMEKKLRERALKSMKKTKEQSSDRSDS